MQIFKVTASMAIKIGKEELGRHRVLFRLEDIMSDSTSDSIAHHVKRRRRQENVSTSSDPRSATSWYDQAQSNKNRTTKEIKRG
jgi:hypothetical protein